MIVTVRRMGEAMEAMSLSANGDHRAARAAQARSRYVHGEIDLDEFEDELDLIFGLRPPNETDRDSAGRLLMMTGAASANDIRWLRAD